MHDSKEIMMGPHHNHVNKNCMVGRIGEHTAQEWSVGEYRKSGEQESTRYQVVDDRELGRREREREEDFKRETRRAFISKF